MTSHLFPHKSKKIKHYINFMHVMYECTQQDSTKKLLFILLNFPFPIYREESNFEDNKSLRFILKYKKVIFTPEI